MVTLGDLAAKIGADLVAGGADAAPPAGTALTGLAPVSTAGPAEVAFVANPKYAAAARTTRAAAVIVDRTFAPLPGPTLRVPDAKYAFTLAVAAFHRAPAFAPGIHPTAVIAPSAKLGPRAHIGPFVVVGEGCEIGADAIILAHAVLYPGVRAGHRLFVHAHAVIRENCLLGDEVTLQNGVIIGSDGFGFARSPEGHWVKTLHPGPAVLEDRVEIQANACVDRAILGETRVGRGAKIDNLVQVGHACSVGPDSLLCAQVGLAGSTQVGRNVTLAGQVGVAGHLHIGDGAIATAQTGIPSDVAPGAVVSGYPAMDNRAWLRMVASLQRLPALLRQAHFKGAE